MGDSQSIAIGIQNNDVVGPHRTGPRNQRRTPTVVNTAFYPKLMWNGRFSADSGNPFDNSAPFRFPLPEGVTKFPTNDPKIRHLLQAQAFIPPTELNEVGGFTGTRGTPYSLGPRFDPFDDGKGIPVPPPDAAGFRNEPIRQLLTQLLNASPTMLALFRQNFPAEMANNGPIDFSMFGRAIAEFEFELVFANAPLDRFARGERDAMNVSEKRGALLFFGKARCVGCHAVAGAANEMFSDFRNRSIGVPQIAPFFGVGRGNTIFDGPGEDEDFSAEQITGVAADRYKFRTSPLRNAAVQPAFFHNGAFTRIEDAIRHHLDVRRSARNYHAARAGVDFDLTFRLGPIEPVLAGLDPLLATPIDLSGGEFEDLVKFVRDGLLDPRARRHSLCGVTPRALPSGLTLPRFEGCEGQQNGGGR
jgi:cytochrome c peroxidase